MDFLLVSDLLQKIDNLVEKGIAANLVKVTDAITPLFYAAFTLYVVYIAYRIVVTQQETVMSDVIKNIAVFGLITAVISANGGYTHYVVPFVMHAGQDLASAVLGTTDTATQVDDMWDSLKITLDKFYTEKTESTGWFGTSNLMNNFVVLCQYSLGYLAGLLLILLVSVYLTVSMFMVGLLLSVGVIFICFAPFPPTRNMFTSWTGSCLNYVMLNVFYSIAFSLMLEYLKQEASIKTFDILFGVKFLLITLICGFCITQIGSLCSSLTGGVGINGLVSSVSSGLRMGSGALASAARSGSRAGKSLYDMIKNRGKPEIKGG